MPWLLRDDEVLAAVELAATRRDRHRGLLGRDGVEGAILLSPARSVHTLGMRFPIDVAFCRPAPSPSPSSRSSAPSVVPSEPLIAALVVLGTTSMAPLRIGRPRLRATCVIEAEAGAFERWRLRPGDRLEIR